MKKTVMIFCIMQLFLRLHSQSAYDYYDKGWAFFNKYDYENALKSFSEGIAFAPDNPSGYYYRSQVYIELNKFDLALADLNTAISIKGLNYLYYHMRGVVYKTLKEYGKAVNDFDTSLELNNNNAKAYIYKAQIKYFQNDYKSSLSLFDKAALYDPYNANIYFFKLFVSYQFNHMVDQETLDLLKYNRRLFSQWQIIITDLFLDKITPDKALKIANQDDELSEIYFYTAMKYLFNGQNDKAKEFYQKCLDTNMMTYLEYQIADFELNKK